jgi:hypothetical protein
VLQPGSLAPRNANTESPGNGHSGPGLVSEKEQTVFKLTNRNIRNRYIAEKIKAKKAGGRFTYQDMARMFDTDDRAVYTWVSTLPYMQHLPTNEVKRNKLTAWINDGTVKERK